MSDDPNLQVDQFMLPGFMGGMGWSCHAEWCAERVGIRCGCPTCLERDGLTLLYNVEDWNSERRMEATWRKRIVSLRIARLAARLIVPNYPGYHHDDTHWPDSVSAIVKTPYEQPKAFEPPTKPP